MAQSSVLPSMRGILSAGNWKILKVTSGRSRPNCRGRNITARKKQRNHRLDMGCSNHSLLHPLASWERFPSPKHFRTVLFYADWVYSEGSGEKTTVKFCVLASGSSGNAALLATENTRILVDAGLSMRELRKRLASIGESLENIDAILITHEHSDHVAGLPVLARNKDVRAVICMTLLAAPAIDWGAQPPERLEPFHAGTSFRVGDIEGGGFGTTPSTRWATASKRRGSASAWPPIWATCRSPSSFICGAPTCCSWRPITIWTSSKGGGSPRDGDKAGGGRVRVREG